MSTLRTNTLQDAIGNNSVTMATVAAGTAKAWVNYNGTAQTIRANFNVSRITWNSAGNYTVNFATALADSNYAVALSNSAATGDANEINVIAGSFGGNPTLMTSTQLQVGGIPDTGMASIIVFR